MKQKVVSLQVLPFPQLSVRVSGVIVQYAAVSVEVLVAVTVDVPVLAVVVMVMVLVAVLVIVVVVVGVVVVVVVEAGFVTVVAVMPSQTQADEYWLGERQFEAYVGIDVLLVKVPQGVDVVARASMTWRAFMDTNEPTPANSLARAIILMGGPDVVVVVVTVVVVTVVIEVIDRVVVVVIVVESDTVTMTAGAVAVAVDALVGMISQSRRAGSCSIR